MNASKSWFEVDKEGLGKALTARGVEFAVGELIQNAWDADGVGCVTVVIKPVPGRPEATLVVEDDSPGGFADLAHTYRLFGGSTKADDPTKRGKWDLGEKLVFAIAREAEVVSTTGGVRFDKDGRHSKRTKTQRGSRVSAVIPMTRGDIDRCLGFVQRLISPPTIQTTINGVPLPTRTPVATVENVTLETHVADDDGKLRTRWRACNIHVHEVEEGETGTLYEMGLPVQDTGDDFHYDVQQRVPVGLDRDSVTDYYLTCVRAAVANTVGDKIPDPSATWVTRALESNLTSEATVKTIVRGRFGEKVVAYDPTDTEAVAKATSAGYTVVHGGSLSAGAWENVRRADALPRAGRVFPTRPKPGDFEEIPEDKYTFAMSRTRAYVRALGQRLLDFDPSVRFIRQVKGVWASWNEGTKTITFNMTNIPEDHWPKLTWSPIPEPMIELIIHEFGHEGAGPDHLSDKYHANLCRLAAKMRNCAGLEYVQ